MPLRIPTEEDYRRLWQGCEENNVTDVKALCREVAFNLSREYGYDNDTALHIAARNGHAEVVLVLLREGADLEATNQRQFTPLHWAALFGHISIVQLLLALGADLHAVTECRYTPLHFAADNGHLAVVRVLLGAGAGLQAED